MPPASQPYFIPSCSQTVAESGAEKRHQDIRCQLAIAYTYAYAYERCSDFQRSSSQMQKIEAGKCEKPKQDVCNANDHGAPKNDVPPGQAGEMPGPGVATILHLTTAMAMAVATMSFAMARSASKVSSSTP